MDNVNNSQKTGKFQDFINPAAIICRSNLTSSDDVIAELVDLAVAGDPSLDKDAVKAGVFAREAIFPTVIAPGLAMPHARVAGLDKLVVALATSYEGVNFGSGDDLEKVRVIVLVLSPADNPGLHLHVVSALAKEFSDLSKIDQLAELENVDEMVAFFGMMQVRLPDYLKVGDLASGIGPVLQANDSLAFAFRKFGESRAELIPVLDDEGNLLGVVTLRDILKYNLPMDYVLKDDLARLYDLKPLAEVIAKAGSVKVSEVMSTEYEKVCEDVPAALLVRQFLCSNTGSVLVVDCENRLRGEVKLRDLCGKIYWE